MKHVRLYCILRMLGIASSHCLAADRDNTAGPQPAFSFQENEALSPSAGMEYKSPVMLSSISECHLDLHRFLASVRGCRMAYMCAPKATSSRAAEVSEDMIASPNVEAQHVYRWASMSQLMCFIS
jgi:hypothetical protein